MKELLNKRFGPILLPEVHEQALQDLRLSRNQPIREMTTEVTRLIKLAYPEFDETARERFAVKALINSVSDLDTAFYIKEKDPRSMDEVCTMYERYRVLTGQTTASKPAAVKNVKPTETNEPTIANLKEQFSDLITKQAEGFNRKLAQLTETVGQLVQNQQMGLPGTRNHAPPLGSNRAPVPTSSAPPQHPGNFNAAPRSGAPRKPCPRCQQPGHWMRDCPQPEVCFLCG